MPTIIIQHSAVSPPGRVLDVLRSYGHSIQVLRTDAEGSIPANLDNVDAIVTCGGVLSARNTEPNEILEAECVFLASAHAAGIPIMGLCLGAQLLARALGGTVELLKGGPEVGFHEVAQTPDGREDPLFKGIPWWTPQFQWHEDEVTELPPDARLLASSKRTKVQAFAVGTSSYGVQYHPEYTKELVLGHWEQHDPFTEAGGGRDELARQTEREYEEFARHADRFFESVALFLMPVDRMSKGIAHDIEH
jgi:GMP synthase-like glutamine amidotransferase